MAYENSNLSKLKRVGNYFYAFEPNLGEAQYASRMIRSSDGQTWEEIPTLETENDYPVSITGNADKLLLLVGRFDYNNWETIPVLYVSYDEETFTEVPNFTDNFLEVFGDINYYTNVDDFFINESGEYILSVWGKWMAIDELGNVVDKPNALIYENSSKIVFKYDEVFYRVLNDWTVERSTDAITWEFYGESPIHELINPSYDYLRAVMHVKGKIIFVQLDENQNRLIYETRDGVNVIKEGNIPSSFYSVSYSSTILNYANGIYFLSSLVSYATTPRFRYSEDLINWSSIITVNGLTQGSGNGGITIMYIGDRWVFHCNTTHFTQNYRGNIATNTTLSSSGWELITIDKPNSGWELNSDDPYNDSNTIITGIRVVSGSTNNETIYTTDGVNWITGDETERLSVSIPAQWTLADGTMINYSGGTYGSGLTVSMTKNGYEWDFIDFSDISQLGSFTRIVGSDILDGYINGGIFANTGEIALYVKNPTLESWEVYGEEELIGFNQSRTFFIEDTNLVYALSAKQSNPNNWNSPISQIDILFSTNYMEDWGIGSIDLSSYPDHYLIDCVFKVINGKLLSVVALLQDGDSGTSIDILGFESDSISSMMNWEEIFHGQVEAFVYPARYNNNLWGDEYYVPLFGFDHNGAGYVMAIKGEYGERNQLLFSPNGMSWASKVIFSTDDTHSWTEINYALPEETGYYSNFMRIGSTISYLEYPEYSDETMIVGTITPEGNISDKKSYSVYLGELVRDWNNSIVSQDGYGYFFEKVWENPEFSIAKSSNFLDVDEEYELIGLSEGSPDLLNLSSSMIVQYIQGSTVIYYNLLTETELFRFDIDNIHSWEEEPLAYATYSKSDGSWIIYIATVGWWDQRVQGVIHVETDFTITVDSDSESIIGEYIRGIYTPVYNNETPTKKLARLQDGRLLMSNSEGTWEEIYPHEAYEGDYPDEISYEADLSKVLDNGVAVLAYLRMQSWSDIQTTEVDVFISRPGESTLRRLSLPLDIPGGTQEGWVGMSNIDIGLSDDNHMLVSASLYVETYGNNYNYFSLYKNWKVNIDTLEYTPIKLSVDVDDGVIRPPRDSIQIGNVTQTLPNSPAILATDKTTNSITMLLRSGGEGGWG